VWVKKASLRSIVVPPKHARSATEHCPSISRKALEALPNANLPAISGGGPSLRPPNLGEAPPAKDPKDSTVCSVRYPVAAKSSRIPLRR
jgi:hypothetical protein